MENIGQMKAGEKFAWLMENILWATPLTDKGRKAIREIKTQYPDVDLNEFEYLNRVYVPPFTGYDTLEEENTKNIDTDLSAKQEDATILNRKQEIIVRDKQNFENNLKNLIESLFIIQGVSGCGKTTYIHKLKQDNIYNVVYHICDLESSAEGIKLFDRGKEDIDINLSAYYEKSNVWKFISVLLMEVSNLLSINGKTDEEYEQYIKDIAAHYQKIKILPQLSDVRFKDFFQIFYRFENVGDFFISIKRKIEDKLNAYNKNQEKEEAVSYIVGILIRLIFCLYHNDSYKKKHLLVVDNIERFIPNHPEIRIQDCDVETMVKGVSMAISNFRPIIDKYKESDTTYSSCFGILLAIRDTTDFLSSVVHNVDYGKLKVDISDWFCAKEINSSKQDFPLFKNIIQNIPEIQPYVKAFNYIMKDFSKHRWGLHNLITLMYNHNYRRINKNLVQALSYVEEEDIKHFNSQWKFVNNELDKLKKYSSSKIKTNDEIEKEKIPLDHIKHICRRFIVRILLDYVNIGTGYLQELTHSRNSYSRKIVTRLYRIWLDKPKSDNKYNYTSFNELIKVVLKKPMNQDVSDAELDKFTELLYKMNEIDNIHTHWNALISIKYDTAKQYNLGELKSIIKDEWKNKKDSNLYGVRITDSGRFFSKIVSDFEYFACRYSPETHLFSKSSLRINPASKVFFCVECIRKVRDESFTCIDNVIKRTVEFLSSSVADSTKTDIAYLYDDNNSWLYKEPDGMQELHPIRIIKNHIGFLNNYISYLEKLPDTDFEKNTYRWAIILEIVKEISYYKEESKKRIKNNKEFFGNININFLEQ